jgi:hypothetical protein
MSAGGSLSGWQLHPVSERNFRRSSPIDMEEVIEYFRLFGKEALLEELLA